VLLITPEGSFWETLELAFNC